MKITFFLISFVLSFVLPALVEFVLMLTKAAAYSPVANIVSPTNFQWIRGLFSWKYEGKNKVSVVSYILISIILGINVFALAFSLNTFGTLDDIAFREKISYAYLFFILSAGFHAGLRMESGARANFAGLVNSLFVGLTAVSLLFAGINIETNYLLSNFLNLTLLIIAQPLISLLYGKWFKSGTLQSDYEKLILSGNRIALNVILMAGVFDFLDANIGQELVFLSLALSFGFELLSRFVSFDSPSSRGMSDLKLTKYLIFMVIVISIVKVVL